MIGLRPPRILWGAVVPGRGVRSRKLNVPISIYRSFSNRKSDPSITGSLYQATWVLDPSVTKEELIEGMDKFAMNIARIKDISGIHQTPISGHHHLTILATPKFAYLLGDNNSFIPTLLKTILKHSVFRAGFERMNVQVSKPTVLDTTVVAACVDGLAPALGDFWTLGGEHPRQGISLRYSAKSFDVIQSKSDSDSISHQLDHDRQSEQEEQVSGMLSTLTFHAMGDGGKITLPLANTLFTNGRLSTLFLSEWRLQDNSLQLIDSISSAVNGDVKTSAYYRHARRHLPIFPLTPARKIVSGLGNIIRQLQFAGEVGPASRELEASVDDYFEATGRPKSALEVWALIIPEEACQGRRKSLLELTPEKLKFAWEDKHPLPSLTNALRYYGLNGAVFSRVLSGGGGWGVKQGLLSLDPQTTYNTSQEPRYDHSSQDQTIEEQQTSALGSIAKPGSYIQFFLAKGLSDTSRVEAYDARKLRYTTILGAVPSTMDDIPAVNTGIVPELEGDERIKYIPKCFGAVSESGIFITTPHNTTSKLDIPFSYVKDIRVESPKTQGTLVYRRGNNLDPRRLVRLV